MEVTNNISNGTYSDNAVEYSNRKQSTTSDFAVRDKKENQSKEVIVNPNGGQVEAKGIGIIPEDMAKAIISEINKKINRNTTAHFSFHEKTNSVMIKITDSETNEVIKEIPPEKTLDMIAKIWELAGVLVDDKR